MVLSFPMRIVEIQISHNCPLILILVQVFREAIIKAGLNMQWVLEGKPLGPCEGKETRVRGIQGKPHNGNWKGERAG